MTLRKRTRRAVRKKTFRTEKKLRTGSLPMGSSMLRGFMEFFSATRNYASKLRRGDGEGEVERI